MDDFVDERDLKHVAAAIITQGMDDYVKLQPPHKRKYKYMHEHFLSAVDMFFDPDYRFANIENSEGEPASIQDLFGIAIDRQQPDMSIIQSHLIDQAKHYWEERDLDPLEIPDVFTIEGEVWTVQHSPQFSIEIESRYLYLDRNASNATESFICGIFSILKTVYAQSPDNIATLWYEVLKMNNGFIP